jgi:hypothetical protein
VLRTDGDQIAETTTFGPELFAAFGLPKVLPEVRPEVVPEGRVEVVPGVRSAS